MSEGKLNYPPASPVPQFYDCGICDAYHPAQWNGDCRDDSARFFPELLDEHYSGPEGWEEVDMPGSDDTLVAPCETKVVDGQQLDYFLVEVPGDLEPTEQERDEYAFYLAREQASDYRVPANWEIISRSRPNGEGYVTYRMCRTSNADRVLPIPGKERT
jgi:hypothetical protein